ncbi:uncharacterized protein LOC121677923 [Alosa sapidissima]|uniref:uncharacterized protein LOC121677923 n=1 Tax=Alosa sapidissima TaxID=34773 RepID=UPI001C0881F1|nr:uncharacterized protein LOC121677923 [Alosa sapidissima]
MNFCSCIAANRCSNAKKGPHTAYNAYKQFVQTDTTALFLAAAMEHFHMDDVTEGVIPDHVLQGTEVEKRTWLHDTVADVVDRFMTSTDTLQLSAAVTGAARAEHTGKEKLPCRQPGCTRVYVNKKSRENHEQKVHHLVAASVPPAASSSMLDYKKQHTEARLCFGFLPWDMLDAVKEGDGERLLRLYKMPLLMFKAYGHTKLHMM